ncbi:Acg family FMN-binding oxidoreductase [Nocardia jejuensis]|uniref:Acg family FMN-binding oxidoreductase n=1 Tax=Nocardia jejuensis TaxID=328049 RepID=UPI0008350FC7|nr:hypothetical protein [Nocardia jejuensis]
MAFVKPSVEVFESAVALAVRAPSVHNTQPWRWRLSETAIHLYADASRQLSVTDPTQRELLMSCGAALHHMRVALAMLGWSARVTHCPDPDDPDHLARIQLTAAHPTAADIELAAAIAHRRSDRRRYGSREVQSRHVRTVSGSAAASGAVARQVPASLRAPLARAAHLAADRHAADDDYLGELASWTGRTDSTDGVPAGSTPPFRPQDEVPQRAFTHATLTDTDEETDASEWLVVCTASDTRVDQLRAGEAASALLLTATGLGLASCMQTEPLELPDLRAAIRTELLYDCAFPHAIIRLGWLPATAAPLRSIPRRDPAEVIDTPASAH